MDYRLEITYESNIEDSAYQILKEVIKIIRNLILHFFLFFIYLSYNWWEN